MLRVTAGTEGDENAPAGSDLPKRPDLALVPTEEPLPPVVTAAERRGIGRWTQLAGVGIDAAIIAGYPLIRWRGQFTGFVVIYTIVAVIMLYPSHRKGRLVPRPSELVATIGLRIAVAPFIAALSFTYLSQLDKL